jgi:hypothetical protein
VAEARWSPLLDLTGLLAVSIGAQLQCAPCGVLKSWHIRNYQGIYISSRFSFAYAIPEPDFSHGVKLLGRFLSCKSILLPKTILPFELSRHLSL